MNNQVQILILAAGRSSRIQDPTTKMLHKVGELKILERVIKNVKDAGLEDIHLILGHQSDLVHTAFKEYPWIHQPEQLGTGNAVLMAHFLTEKEHTLVLFGDKPLLRPETIANFVKSHIESGKVITASTVIHPTPENYSEGYGTVIRIGGKIVALKKTEDTLECDGGMYIFKTGWLWRNIERLEKHEKQNKVEYYLPDMIEMAINDRLPINEFLIPDYREATGINTPAQKAEAEKYLKELNYTEA